VPRDVTDELDVIETEADIEGDGDTLFVPNREADWTPDSEEVTVGVDVAVVEALVFADFEDLGEDVDVAETEGDLDVVTEGVFVVDGDVLFVEVFETMLVRVHEAVFVDVADTFALGVCAGDLVEELLADVVLDGALLGLEAAEKEGDFVDVADFVLVLEAFAELDVVDEGELRGVDDDDKDADTVGVYDIVLTEERVPRDEVVSLLVAGGDRVEVFEAVLVVVPDTEKEVRAVNVDRPEVVVVADPRAVLVVVDDCFAVRVAVFVGEEDRVRPADNVAHADGLTPTFRASRGALESGELTL